MVKVGGTSKLLSEVENGFIVEKGNYKGLAAILENLNSNCQIRSKIGKKYLQEDKNFTWEAIDKNMLKCSIK